MESFPIEQD
jgi:hypothetical protein